KGFDGQRPSGKAWRGRLECAAHDGIGLLRLAVQSEHLAPYNRRFNRPHGAKRVKSASRFPPRGIRCFSGSDRAERECEAERRLDVVGVERQRMLETGGRFFGTADAQKARAASVERAHLVLAAVEQVRLRQLLLAFGLAYRLLDIILRETDEGEHP